MLTIRLRKGRPSLHFGSYQVSSKDTYPHSGMLFALVMDPFLRCMKAIIQDKNLAQIRACADDVGAALKSIRVLKLFEPIFRVAAESQRSA